jgi:hypothetical protein
MAHIINNKSGLSDWWRIIHGVWLEHVSGGVKDLRTKRNSTTASSRYVRGSVKNLFLGLETLIFWIEKMQLFRQQPKPCLKNIKTERKLRFIGEGQEKTGKSPSTFLENK